MSDTCQRYCYRGQRTFKYPVCPAHRMELNFKQTRGRGKAEPHILESSHGRSARNTVDASSRHREDIASWKYPFAIVLASITTNRTSEILRRPNTRHHNGDGALRASHSPHRPHTYISWRMQLGRGKWSRNARVNVYVCMYVYVRAPDSRFFARWDRHAIFVTTQYGEFTCYLCAH